MGTALYTEDTDLKGVDKGSLTPLTDKNPEKAADNPKQGIWQKLRPYSVPLLYVLIATAILLTVIIILTALLSVRGETLEAQVLAQCEDDWISYRGKCYYFSDQTDTWNNSQDFCKFHNSSLAIINDEKEMKFLNLLKSNMFWIGLSRTPDDSGWVWTNGTFLAETTFDIHRKPTDPGESEHVFLNGDGFKSEGGRYPKKWICSKRLSR